MSALSRRKGRENQSALAKRWRDSGLWVAARSTQGEQTRGAQLGPKPPDIEGTPFWIEAKHRKAAQPIQALRQAELESELAADWRPCVAVVREHGTSYGDAVVVMRLRDFESVCRIADWARYVTPGVEESEAAE